MPATMARSIKIKIAKITLRDMAGSKSHNVVAAVYVEGFARNSRSKIGRKEQGGIPHFFRLYVPFERCTFSVMLQHKTKIAHAARGQGLDGAGGDGIDPDVLRAD